MIKPWVINSGYYAIAPRLNGQNSKALVHVLVAMAFHGEKPFDKAEVCHRDDQKLNNHADNLRWDSHVRNYDDAKRNQRTPRGERNGQSRLVEADVREIRRLASEGMTPTEIGRQLGFNREIVGKIVRRERWAWLE